MVHNRCIAQLRYLAFSRGVGEYPGTLCAWQSLELFHVHRPLVSPLRQPRARSTMQVLFWLPFWTFSEKIPKKSKW